MRNKFRIAAFAILWLVLALIHSQLIFGVFLPFNLNDLFRWDALLLIILTSLLLIPTKDTLFQYLVNLQFDNFISSGYVTLFVVTSLTWAYIYSLFFLLPRFPVSDELVKPIFVGSSYFVFRLCLHSVQYLCNKRQLSKPWLSMNIFSAFLTTFAFCFNYLRYDDVNMVYTDPQFFLIWGLAELITVFSYVKVKTKNEMEKSSE